jgi:hypothetical protein
MALSHEGVGSKIPAKINTYMLNRAELLITLCYETPCTYLITLITIIVYLKSCTDYVVPAGNLEGF